LIVNDQNARMAALRSGRADVATFDDPDTPKVLKGTPSVRVVAQDSSDFYAFDLNAIGKASKLKDPRIRSAIALAIDREQIIKLALGGSGRVVAGAGTVPGLPDACNITSFSKPDIDQARAMISAAGATGLEFGIEINTTLPIFSKIGQVIQAELQQAGLKPRLNPEEQASWIGKLHSGSFDANITFYTAAVDNWFGLANWSPSTVGFTKGYAIDDAAYDRLLHESATLGQGKNRAAVFQRMCDLAAGHANMLPLATRSLFVAYRADRVRPHIQPFETHSDALRYIADFVPSGT
jgi:peptide/nickel transport system substrate-binding protein